MKKQRIGPDFTKCLYCQQANSAALSNATMKGIAFKTLKKRKEAGDCELYDDIKSFINDEGEGWSLKSTDMHLVWYIGCYSSFTSKDHLPSTVHDI